MTERRFQINPGPLKVYRDQFPPVREEDQGRCAAQLKDGSGRCLYDALDGETLCGIHLRSLRRD